MKMKAWIAFFIPVFLVGCATEPLKIPRPPETRIVLQPPALSQSEQLLKHFESARKFDVREFTKQREDARSLFQRDKSTFNRINYALMLALPVASTSPSGSSTVQDDVELINILDPVVAAGNQAPDIDSDARALALLLHGMATERRKIREHLRDAQARLSLSKKEDRDAEARALRVRIEELETRLDALKSIDRSVNRRTAPSQK